MKITINIDDYLTDEDKKTLCVEYVRETLRGNAARTERVLSNMAYHAAFSILDSVLTKEMLAEIKQKATEQITNVSDFGIFRKKDAWGSEDSLAYIEVKKAVEEHKHLIGPLVKKAMLERDYLGDLPKSSDYIAEVIIDAISRGIK